MADQWAKLSVREVSKYAEDEDFKDFVVEYARDVAPFVDTEMLKKLTQCYFASLASDFDLSAEKLFKDKMYLYGTINGVMNCLTYLPLPAYMERHRIFFIRQILNKIQDIIKE